MSKTKLKVTLVEAKKTDWAKIKRGEADAVTNSMTPCLPSPPVTLPYNAYIGETSSFIHFGAAIDFVQDANSDPFREHKLAASYAKALREAFLVPEIRAAFQGCLDVHDLVFLLKGLPDVRKFELLKDYWQVKYRNSGGDDSGQVEA